jgi:general secretion pathway protein F
VGAYAYSALDRTGRTAKGLLEGDTARHVRQQLRERGLTPLTVEEVARREARERKRPSLRGGISALDLALLTRQIATLVRAGLPLDEALSSVSQQSEKRRVKSLVLALRARVVEGHSLAAGLDDFPHVFPELYRATVAAGERSGHLHVALERLADYAENRQRMQQKIRLALFYPSLVTLVALLVAVGLLTYVVPQVVQVFQSIGQELPWLTRALIATSDFLRGQGLLLLGVLAVMLFAGRAAMRRAAPRALLHRLALGLPLTGRLIRGLNAARFSRTFSILLASGVPVLEALRISAQVMSSLPMRSAVEDAAARVREGGSVHAALERSRCFPPMTVHLIASGEASGTLENMLERAADNQEREVEALVAAIMGLFEPLLILFMGGLVLIIVLAILLPIFELNQLVR